MARRRRQRRPRLAPPVSPRAYRRHEDETEIEQQLFLLQRCVFAGAASSTDPIMALQISSTRPDSADPGASLCLDTTPP